MRFAILILVIFFLYRYFRKKKTRKDWPDGQFGPGRTYNDGTFEEMVEDPYCKVFIQKGRAIKERIGTRTYYFCSKECRDRYLEKMKTGQ
ncbi:MAG: hypothetical protein DRG59_07240 [Deltaproteobacteria bacterium]|nr:MAG: hypothetical protein DRG59_07240 [Deltaproteobacteria bacterium]